MEKKRLIIERKSRVMGGREAGYPSVLRKVGKKGATASTSKKKGTPCKLER